MLKRTHDYNLPTSYSCTSACSSLHRHLCGFFRSSRTLRILLILRPGSPDGSVPSSLSVASAFSRFRLRGPTSREHRQRPMRDYRVVSLHPLERPSCTLQYPCSTHLCTTVEEVRAEAPDPGAEVGMALAPETCKGADSAYDPSPSDESSITT